MFLVSLITISLGRYNLDVYPALVYWPIEPLIKMNYTQLSGLKSDRLFSSSWRLVSSCVAVLAKGQVYQQNQQVSQQNLAYWHCMAPAHIQPHSASPSCQLVFVKYSCSLAAFDCRLQCGFYDLQLCKCIYVRLILSERLSISPFSVFLYIPMFLSRNI